MGRRSFPRALVAAAAALLITATLRASDVMSPVPPQAPAENGASSHELRRRGLELAYSLDYPEALATFRAAMAADPTDPAPPRLAAFTIWLNLLFDQGAITADDYLGESRGSVSRDAPDPAPASMFHEYVAHAIALAQRQVAVDPKSAGAHYHLGAAYALAASYTATVEGRVAGSFGSSRRAYQEHERVLELDPSRLDAGLVVGLYRCAVAELSLPIRLIVNLAGIGGDRDRGLRLVEGAAQYPGDAQPNAEFMRVLLYSRAGRFDDALTVIDELKARFPRNRLLWLEEGVAALSAGQPDRARAAIETGLARAAAETRPLAAGELSRWRFAHGMVLVAQRETGLAACELRAALEDARRDWVRGRIHRELGKLADLAGSRPQALVEYRLAERFCKADHDEEGVRSVRELEKSAYR